jgi:hypothetical protein
MAVEPGPRLLHGVAVLDAVDGDAHFDLPALNGYSGYLIGRG